MGDASGRVIAVANMKGGVGKTTTVVMLAEGFAAEGARVVVLDLDAQASASYCFAPDDELKTIISARKTITSFLADRILLNDRVPIHDYLTPEISKVTKAGEALPIDMVAASPRLRLLEREIILKMAEGKFGARSLEGQSLRVLQKAIGELKETYDVILFDCAPGISAFTEVAIRLADLVVVPTIPDFLSTLGFEAFRLSIWENAHVTRSSLPRPLRRPAVLPTRVSGRKRQHREVLDALMAEAGEADAPFELFGITIGDQAAIERAMDPEQFAEAPTFEQKWGASVASVRGLVNEIRRRLDG